VVTNATANLKKFAVELLLGNQGAILQRNFKSSLHVFACFALVIFLGPVSRLHAQTGLASIYSDTADARAEIRAAIASAAREHKHVLLDFGANWCPDCHLLNIYFHDPSNAGVLQTNYVLVDVNVGRYDKNLDVAQKYGIPLNKGIPALVVLDGQGHVLYAQRHGEFEKMRNLDSSDVMAFLEKWKPKARQVLKTGNSAAKSVEK